MNKLLKLAFCVGIVVYSGMSSALDKGKDVQDSIRPCIDKIKSDEHYLYDSYEKILKEEEIKKCYEDSKIYDKYHNKSISEFALWLGVYAIVEKMNDELANLVSLGSKTGKNTHKDIPDNYNGIPTVWAEEIMYSYELNEKDADEHFRDKEIVVVGVVRGISWDKKSKAPVIEMVADSLGLQSVFIELDKSSRTKAEAVDRGSTIAVAGTVKGGDSYRVDLSNGKIQDINL